MSNGFLKKIYVTFWGTRGSISTPGATTEKYGGNTACVSIDHNDTRIVLDAGTGIRNYGIWADDQKDSIEDIHLLLSHTHWDHIQGLPFFSPVYSKGQRLHIYGSPKKGRFLESVLQGQMDTEYFPVQMNSLAADISIIEMAQETFSIGELAINWEEQKYHPGSSIRYSFAVNGKKVVYATDVELNMIFKSNPGPDEKKMAAQYQDFVSNADLLIADAQYTAEEYNQHKGFGHTSLPVITEAAYDSGVKQLALFHHDPRHSDTMIDKLAASYRPKYAERSPPMNMFWAREGMTLGI